MFDVQDNTHFDKRSTELTPKSQCDLLFGLLRQRHKIKYIEEQQEHHMKISFREDYLEFLKENEIEFDERYIFKPVE